MHGIPAARLFLVHSSERESIVMDVIVVAVTLSSNIWERKYHSTGRIKKQ